MHAMFLQISYYYIVKIMFFSWVTKKKFLPYRSDRTDKVQEFCENVLSMNALLYIMYHNYVY